MVRLAAGELGRRPRRDRADRRAAHAIEVRLYAEDPGKRLPARAAGLLTEVAFPADARVDTWVEPGTEITPLYDPLLAKIIVHGADRDAALARAARRARRDRRCAASRPTSTYLAAIAAPTVVRVRSASRTGDARPPSRSRPRRSTCSRRARRRRCRTARPARLLARRRAAERADGRPLVPPRQPHRRQRRGRRGARDARSPGRRCASTATATICLGGAGDGGDARRRAGAVLGRRSPSRPAQVLTLGRIAGPRAAHLSRRARRLRRAALSRQPRRPSRSAASAATAAGVLRTGDVLHLGADRRAPTRAAGPTRCPSRSCPRSPREWELGVLDGPHGAPDFFTEDDIATLFDARLARCTSTRARTGVRLIGPQAAMGARRRRRGRAAPVEHPRQRLRGRHRRLHRRHADPARPRRPEPRRLRLPGDGHRRPSGGSSASSRPATRVRFVPVDPRRGAGVARRARSPRSRRATAPLRGAVAARARRSTARRRPVPRRASTPLDGRRPRRSPTAAPGDDYLLVEYGPMRSTSTCASARTR